MLIVWRSLCKKGCLYKGAGSGSPGSTTSVLGGWYPHTHQNDGTALLGSWWGWLDRGVMIVDEPNGERKGGGGDRLLLLLISVPLGLSQRSGC